MNHNDVSIFEKDTDKKNASRKLKKHIVVHKDARFITLFQVHTYDDSEFLLVSKCIPIIPCTFPLC